MSHRANWCYGSAQRSSRRKRITATSSALTSPGIPASSAARIGASRPRSTAKSSSAPDGKAFYRRTTFDGRRSADDVPLNCGAGNMSTTIAALSRPRRQDSRAADLGRDVPSLLLSVGRTFRNRLQKVSYRATEVETKFVEIAQIHPSGAIIVKLCQHVPANPRRPCYVNQSDPPFPHQP